MSRSRPLVIGLTGGIGSGKSAAADHFSLLGATLVDTDRIAHELTASNGNAIPALRATFGDHIITPDNALDRPRMRTLAFSDPCARKRLEAVLHPAIRVQAEQACSDAQGAYVVLVVPLLVESGAYRERVARVCVVDCPETVQIERVRNRSGLPDQQIRAIIESQATRSERLAIADDVIDNSGTLAQLHVRVAELHAAYLELKRARSQRV